MENIKTYDYQTALAWYMYCVETAGTMDIRDSWEQCSPYIQSIYLDKAERFKTTYVDN